MKSALTAMLMLLGLGQLEAADAPPATKIIEETNATRTLRVKSAKHAHIGVTPRC